MPGHGQLGGSAWAGIDVGGSGLRVRVQVGGSSVDSRREVALPRAQGRVDVPGLCALVVGEVRALMSTLNLTHPDGIALGMTGIPGLVDDPAALADRLRAHVDAQVALVASDALTTHLGALDGAPGAVVAAGTGVISLGTDLRQVWRKVDGWGLFLGDEGSGAWVGRQGLRAALRALDGRVDGSPGLHERMQAQFGQPHALLRRIHAAELPARELASFAPAVAAVAQDEDQVAVAIWQEAGARLADAAVAAARDLPARISWGGGLFRVGGLLINPFRTRVQQLMPEAQLCEPAGTGLDGTFVLAHQVMSGTLQAREPYLYVSDRRGG